MDEGTITAEEADWPGIGADRPSGATTGGAPPPPRDDRRDESSPSFLAAICGLFAILFGLRAAKAIAPVLAHPRSLHTGTWLTGIAFCSGLALELLLSGVFAALALHFLRQAGRRS